MHLAPGTVENYRRRIQKKVGVKNVVGIAIYALLSGLLKRGPVVE